MFFLKQKVINKVLRSFINIYWLPFYYLEFTFSNPYLRIYLWNKFWASHAALCSPAKGVLDYLQSFKGYTSLPLCLNFEIYPLEYRLHSHTKLSIKKLQFFFLVCVCMCTHIKRLLRVHILLNLLCWLRWQICLI